MEFRKPHDLEGGRLKCNNGVIELGSYLSGNDEGTKLHMVRNFYRHVQGKNPTDFAAGRIMKELDKMCK